jgi:hypothetical protein
LNRRGFLVKLDWNDCSFTTMPDELDIIEVLQGRKNHPRKHWKAHNLAGRPPIVTVGTPQITEARYFDD